MPRALFESLILITFFCHLCHLLPLRVSDVEVPRKPDRLRARRRGVSMTLSPREAAFEMCHNMIGHDVWSHDERATMLCIYIYIYIFIYTYRVYGSI